MGNVIVVIAVLILLIGGITLISPNSIFDPLGKYIDKAWLYVLAIVVRLVLGGTLIYQAGLSKYPFVIEIIGWIAIVAAIVFALMGHHKFKQAIRWVLSRAKPFYRLAGFAAFGFGGFLLYAFI